MNQLRKLALAVDEPEPGEFYWIILESKGDAMAWQELSSGMHGLPRGVKLGALGLSSIQRWSRTIESAHVAKLKTEMLQALGASELRACAAQERMSMRRCRCLAAIT